MLKVLILEDNLQVSFLLKKQLSSVFEVITIDSPTQALETLKTDKIDVIISDFHLPEMNGVDFLNQVSQKVFKILLTGDENKIVQKSIQKNQIDLFIKKPFSIKEIAKTILANVSDSNQNAA